MADDADADRRALHRARTVPELCGVRTRAHLGGGGGDTDGAPDTDFAHEPGSQAERRRAALQDARRVGAVGRGAPLSLTRRV
jgi:hypothetical protein